MILVLYLSQEVIQSRHHRWKLFMFIQYAKEQQAQREGKVGEPGDQVFLHDKEKIVRPVIRC